MDWSDTPEQAAFREEVRRYIADRLPRYYREASKRRQLDGEPEGNWQHDAVLGSPEAQAAAREWAAALHEKGWVAPGWPREYGGGGLSTIEQFILRQEFASARVPQPGGSGVGLLGPTLLVHGTDDQKKRFLPKTLSGEYLWAQGYSEPGAGSDLASLQCRAVRDGDEFVINGQKLWTSGAHMANWIFMLVRTDPDAPKHRGISFIMADMKTPGITVRPIISMDWVHATNETFYEGVRVPADQVVGEINRGWYVGMTLLDFERSGIASAAQQRADLDELVEHLRLDGSPNRCALVRHEVADRAMEIEINGLLSMRIASMQAHGMIPNYEASMGKTYSTELWQRFARTGTKVFGLYGGLWDPGEPYTPLRAKHTHKYVGATIITVGGGSSEIQRNIIATRGLGLPRG